MNSKVDIVALIAEIQAQTAWRTVERGFKGEGLQSGKGIMAAGPRVSIGLGVYNGEKFLRQTLVSILSQTYTDFELIISDNASTDATAEICQEFAAEDTRVRYSRNPVNIGLDRNFNRVFELASGQYFRWASADDLFAPTSLEECVDVLDANQDVVLCYPKTVLIDGNGNFIRSYNDNLDIRVPRATDRFRLVLQNIGLINVQYGLMRTDVLRRTALFGGYPGSDIVLIAEIALYGKLWEIPHDLFFRRIHDGAFSALKDRGWEVQKEFVAPTSKDKLDLYYWTHRYHNLRSVFRSPLSLLEKLRLAWFISCYAFRSRNVYLKELRCAGAKMLERLKSSVEVRASKS